MSVSPWGRWLLAACLLAPAAARGQTIEQYNNDTTEPPQRLEQDARTPDLSRVATLVFEGTNRFRHLHGRHDLKRRRCGSVAASFSRPTPRAGSWPFPRVKSSPTLPLSES
jgi:hypothetical protein